MLFNLLFSDMKEPRKEDVCRSIMTEIIENMLNWACINCKILVLIDVSLLVRL